MGRIPTADEMAAAILKKTANTKQRPAQSSEKTLGTVPISWVRTSFSATVPVIIDGESIQVNLPVYSSSLPFPGDRVIVEKFGNSMAITGAQIIGGRTGVAFATGTLVKANSAAFSNIPGVSFTVEANAIYAIQARIDYTAAGSAPTDGDIKTDWSGPGDASWLRRCRGIGTNGTAQANTVMRNSSHLLTTAVSYGTVAGGSYSQISEEGYLYTISSGVIQARAAQDTAVTTCTLTVQNSSFVSFNRIA